MGIAMALPLTIVCTAVLLKTISKSNSFEYKSTLDYRLYCSLIQDT